MLNVYFDVLYKFLLLRRIERDMIKNVYWSSLKVFVIPSNYNKTKFLNRFSKRFSNIKFQENLSSGSRVIACRRTADRRTDITNLIVALRNFLKEHINSLNLFWNPCSILQDLWLLWNSVWMTTLWMSRVK
jgi:hypothetical protein